MQVDYNYLTNIAIDTIWCSPEQDKQYIFKPQRITRPTGAINRVYMLDEYFGLPIKSTRMHVYQVISAPISRFNITLRPNTWMRCDVMASSHNMIISVYTDNGIMRPLEDCWLMETDTKAFILAVSANRRVEANTSDVYLEDDLYSQPVFIKFYSNYYFTIPDSVSNNRDVEIFGRYLKLEADVLAMNAFYTSKLASPGKVYGQVNGFSLPAIVPADYAIGDYVEMIYDSSISEIKVIPLTDAIGFESTMDSMNKYFINPEVNADAIRFYDDFDFYLTKLTGGRHKGVYLHRNALSNIRMVTHDTYSISDPYLQSVIVGQTPPMTTDIRSLYIVIVYRSALNYRPLVNVSNRVGEMYRLAQLLDTPIILKDPTIGLLEWRFANLEASYYNVAMRLPYYLLTNEPVARAFGYHPLAKRLGKSLVPVSGATVSLPVGVRNGCTVFEYNSSGHLLGYYNHTNGNDHARINGSCTKIEVVSGLATSNAEFQQNLGNNIIEVGVGFRLYRLVGQAIEDVTRFTNLYTVTLLDDGTRIINWLVSGNFVVVTDKYFPMVDTTFATGEPIFHIALKGGDQLPVKIPFTDLDVWLNGIPLVENIDYIVKYPSILICCAKHVNDLGSSNRVIVRGRGLRVGSSYRSTAQTGFIEYGLLSNNRVEDFHGDQNLRIIANGGIRLLEDVVYRDGEVNAYLTDTLYYAEDANLATPTTSASNAVVTLGYNQNHALNGTPYSIRDNYVGLAQWVDLDPIELREEAIDWDKRMNAFVTSNRTRVVPSVNNNILVPYRLYSPTIASIIKDLLADQIPQQAYRKPALDKEEIRTLLAPWLTLMTQDPAELSNYRKIDSTAIHIHPHPYSTAVELDTYSWRLLEFISEQFLGGRVDVSLDIVVNDTPNPSQW